MNNKITIEIVVPNDKDTTYEGILYAVRQIFHEAFKGSDDYVDSNVVVYDNRCNTKDHKSFNEIGLLVDFTDTQNGLSVYRNLSTSLSKMTDNNLFTNMAGATTKAKDHYL